MSAMKAKAVNFSRWRNVSDRAWSSRSGAPEGSKPAEPPPRRDFAFAAPPVVLKPRPLDLAETLPHTIRETSDHVQFGGMRVLVRELPAMGWVDVSGGISHYWLGYTPPQTANERAPATKRSGRALHPPLFLAVGTRHMDEWQGAEALTAHFQFQPAFLEQSAKALAIDPRRLQRLGRQEVRLEGALESLCSCLMHEVKVGCPHGTAFFEALSRALALALVRRLAEVERPLEPDPRIELAIEFLERNYQDPIGLKQVAQVVGLSPFHFLRAFGTRWASRPMLTCCAAGYATPSG